MTAIYTPPRTWVDGELVTSSLMNEAIRDNLDYLKARPVARVSDLDGTAGSTTSTSFADVTSASVSITTSGSSRLFITAEMIVNPSGNGTWAMTVNVDGTDIGDATNGLWKGLTNAGTTISGHVSFVSAAALADGAHTVKLRALTSTGTLTFYGYVLNVLEVF